MVGTNNQYTRNLRLATAEDLDAALQLLAECHLPEAGVRDVWPRGFVVLQEAGRIAGCAGVEPYGPSGLLRSVAVDPQVRSGGAGTALMRDRIEWARDCGLQNLYLLTTTAESFFRKLGFRPVDRTEVPGSVRDSLEFRSICPSSAVVMVLNLNPEESNR